MRSANAKVLEAVISPSAARSTTLSGVSSATTAHGHEEEEQWASRAEASDRPPRRGLRCSPMSPVAVVTDTTHYMPRPLVAKLGVKVSLYVTFEGVAGRRPTSSTSPASTRG